MIFDINFANVTRLSVAHHQVGYAQLHVVHGHLVENIGVEWDFGGFTFDEEKGLHVLIVHEDITTFGQAIDFDATFDGDAVAVVAFVLEEVLDDELADKFFGLEHQPFFADWIKDVALLILKFDLERVGVGQKIHLAQFKKYVRKVWEISKISQRQFNCRGILGKSPEVNLQFLKFLRW